MFKIATTKGLRIQHKETGYGPFFKPTNKHNIFTVLIKHIGERTNIPQTDPSIRDEFRNKFIPNVKYIRFAFDTHFFIGEVSNFINAESRSLMVPKAQIVSKIKEAINSCEMEIVEVEVSDYLKTDQQIIYLSGNEKSKILDFTSLKF